MIGTSLGTYEISAELGAGGMGEVYRATDTRLGREVAIKVLPAEVAQDGNRLARFEREARLLASLNHPNIAHVYGFETAILVDGSPVHFLAMELVPGEDLAQRLERGPIPLEEALPLARQIAEALEEAHAKGIIHRDLKPGNIKLTPDGKVKVLDFGLAKAYEGEAIAPTDLSQSPTLTQAATQAGVILGTAAYMSPEQARGKPVDKRSDIWALGAVLYEMLTGRQLFEGETVSDVLAAVLTREPDWSRLPGSTPAAVKRLLRRCLERDPRRRLHDAGDARIELEETPDQPISQTGVGTSHQRSSLRLWALGLAVLVVGFLAGKWISKVPTSTRPPIDLAFTVLPPGQEPAAIQAVDLSEDGRRVVFSGPNGELFVRDLSRFESQVIPGVTDTFPFLSPDGQWVGFFADGKLRKVAFEGGDVIAICDAPEDGPGASWEEDGFIYFSRTYTSGLFRVSADGGVPMQLTSPDRGRGEAGHMWAHLLPGGKSLIFTVFGGSGMNGARIALLDLESQKYEVLLDGAGARYVSSGHLLFYRRGHHYLVPFDAESGQITGPERSVLREVRPPDPTGDRLNFDYSRDGQLAYIPGQTPQVAKPSQLAWVSRNGSIDLLPFEGVHLVKFRAMRISPDGQRVALSQYSSGETNIWIYDLARGTRDQLTRDGVDQEPAWHPDGKHVLYTSVVQGSYNIWWTAIDGSRGPAPLVSTEHDESAAIWTADGKSIIFQEFSEQTGPDIVQADQATPGQRQRLVATPLQDHDFSLSRDGKWLSYISGSALYVSPFPGAATRTLIAQEARVPRWSDTDELFFLSGEDLQVVHCEDRDGTFQAGPPTKLFRVPENATVYDVAPDGSRFLFLFLSPGQSLGDEVRVRINGFDELSATERQE